MDVDGSESIFLAIKIHLEWMSHHISPNAHFLKCFGLGPEIGGRSLHETPWEKIHPDPSFLMNSSKNLKPLCCEPFDSHDSHGNGYLLCIVYPPLTAPFFSFGFPSGWSSLGSHGLATPVGSPRSRESSAACSWLLRALGGWFSWPSVDYTRKLHQTPKGHNKKQRKTKTKQTFQLPVVQLTQLTIEVPKETKKNRGNCHSPQGGIWQSLLVPFPTLLAAPPLPSGAKFGWTIREFITKTTRWFQPVWKVLVKMGIFPREGSK